MTMIRAGALAIGLCLAGCGGDAVGSPPEDVAAGLTVPPESELQAALAGISDPQLRRQVAPDGHYDAADCVVHIGQLDPVPPGHQEALDEASRAWRASLAREFGDETEADQMIGSSVNILQPTPAPLRRAAVAWCVANAPKATSAAAEGTILRLAPNGLATAEAGLHSSGLIAFGQPKDQVVAAVAAIRGAPTGEDSNKECGAEAMTFTEFGPLTLNFQQGRFVGWVLDGVGDPPIEEEYGLGIGTPRADLEQSDQGPAEFLDSTLGEEFDAGGIGGLLVSDAPDATVATLYAGTTCFFR